ncbi:MAG: biopolymer transporter ExbD [Pseudomonadota bacterium]
MGLNLPPSRRRRPSLTPMIDVVFLLLVFFMLASRLGVETAMTVTVGGDGQTGWTGPPRLVDLRADTLALNGVGIALDALPTRLQRLMAAPGDPVILRVHDGTPLQSMVDVIAALQAAGFTGLVVTD